MKKLLLSLLTILVLTSFTTINNPIILKDIDGTLLKSYVSIQQVDNQNTATFTVDANTVVTSITNETGTHVYLVQNGISGVSVEHTIEFNATRIGFDSYFDTNADVASSEGMESQISLKRDKPITIVKGGNGIPKKY